MNPSTKEESSKLVGSTEKKGKKSKERGSNLTPKGSKSLSTCFITFQRQLKQLSRKWAREFEASKGETK